MIRCRWRCIDITCIFIQSCGFVDVHAKSCICWGVSGSAKEFKQTQQEMRRKEHHAEKALTSIMSPQLTCAILVCTSLPEEALHAASAGKIVLEHQSLLFHHLMLMQRHSNIQYI